MNAMSMKRLLIISTLLLSVLNAPTIFSVQSEPIIRFFRQPDGTEFKGRILGDEFVVFYETADGYSIEKNNHGYWCYAQIGIDGKLAASEHIVGEVNPALVIGQKHLRHTSEFMANIQDKRHEFYENLQVFNPGTSVKGNLKNKQSFNTFGSVSYNLAVLLIEFADVGATYSPEDFNQLLFSEGFTYTSPAPGEEAFGSMRDYYNLVSSRMLSINGQVFDWVSADSSKSFYETSDDFIVEAVSKSGVNLSDFDGFVVIYAGTVGSASGKLWPRAQSTQGKVQYTMSEKWLSKYDFAPIGVHCHEFGHLLGLPDLYDTDFSSIGIGIWGLMGSGNYGNGHHERPFLLSVWSKAYLGWISPTVIFDANNAEYSLNPIVTTGEAVKLISLTSFFLLENRQKIGYDLNLPGEGLLIWHIDERFGQQNIEQHRIVDLEEGDGEENSGDAGDPFPGTTFNSFFNISSNPSSQDYDGGSYIEISNIQKTGETISFQVSTDLGPGAGITVNNEGNFPNLFTALESAESKDTVFVSEGTYQASNLLVKEGRVLKGENPLATILDGDRNKVLRVNRVQNTTVTGFTFTNTQTAISVINSNGVISYNIFRDIEGSAITCSNSSPEIRNNTIINGTSAAIGCFSGSKPIIENNIIVYNGLGITNSTNSNPIVRYNNIWNNGTDYRGLHPGLNDISLNPLFVNPIFEDYHLRPGSPCIDMGNPAAKFNDPDGTRNDMGALFFDLEHVTSIEGIRVNAGGQAYLSQDSTFWAPDQLYTEGGWGYIGGEAQSTFNAITNTSDDPLYQNERHAVEAYIFDIPNGRYRVTLHFCEIVWEQAGRRIFEVEIEGRSVVEGFDIYSKTGHDQATSFHFFSDVRDGQLNIQFLPQVGLTQISAIEVVFAQPLLIDVADFAKVAHPASGQGVAIGDYNNDGFQDIFIANAGRANILFRNNGLGVFTNTTLESKFILSGGGKMGVWGDYNNDGHLDIYVVRTAIPNILYQNNGNGTFSEVAEMAGVDDPGKGVACAWGDYDNDGFLDLFVANDGQDVLYRNQGDKTFKNMTDSAGVKNSKLSTDAIFGDINLDGYLDLLVTRDENAASISNLLYINNQDGSFSAKEFEHNGLGATFGDYDNDGDLDVFMVTRSVSEETMLHHLFRNEGEENFIDVSTTVGIISEGEISFAGWIDLDYDSYLDLFLLRPEQPNLIYHNNSNGTFTNIADSAGLEVRDLERSAAFADFDGDGDQDIYIARFGKENLLYQNEGNDNNWLVVKIKGRQNNRAGIGAKIRIVTGHLTQTREVLSGGGFSSQSSLSTPFGLGLATEIDTLEVLWPGGAVKKYTHITDINRIIEVVEDSIVSSVKLLTFTAQVREELITLEWESTNELDFIGFEVERSLDEIHFEKVGSISGSEASQYTWSEKNFIIGTYYYRLKLINVNGTYNYSEILQVNLGPPSEFNLSQNYPNPFNATTTIRYTLPKNGHVTIKIYDILGKEVRTLIDIPQEIGYHTIRWDGHDNSGTLIASGIYYYTLKAGDFVQTKKFILLK